MAATAVISAIAAGSAVYQGETAKGTKREADFQAKKAEEKQAAAVDEAAKRKQAEDLQASKQAEALALRDRQRALQQQTGGYQRDTILTGPLGLTGGSTGGVKTLLGS